MSTQKLSNRLLWFFGLWVAGIASITVVGLAIRLVLKP